MRSSLETCSITYRSRRAAPLNVLPCPRCVLESKKSNHNKDRRKCLATICVHPAHSTLRPTLLTPSTNAFTRCLRERTQVPQPRTERGGRSGNRAHKPLDIKFPTYPPWRAQEGRHRSERSRRKRHPGCSKVLLRRREVGGGVGGVVRAEFVGGAGAAARQAVQRAGDNWT